MNPKTLERLTILNSLVLVIVAGKVFFGVDNSTSTVNSIVEVSTQQATNRVETSRDPMPVESGAQNYEELLLQTIEPLMKAYSEHSEAPNLPTEDELQAAIQTNDVDSPQSKKVMEQLEDGYARFNMPFPKLTIPSAPSNNGNAPMQNQAPENLEPPNYAEWLRRTTDNIRQTIVENEESSVGLLPSEQELQAAIDSNDPLSTESRLAIDILKNTYARLKVDFPEYGVSESISEENDASMQEKISQKRILTAYFQGQLQRLRLEGKAQNTMVDELLPSDQLIEEAIDSGTLKSESSQAALEKIERCYSTLGLKFYRPPAENY